MAKGQALLHNLTQMNPTDFFMIHFNVILSCTRKFPTHLFRCPDVNTEHIHLVPAVTTFSIKRHHSLLQETATRSDQLNCLEHPQMHAIPWGGNVVEVEPTDIPFTMSTKVLHPQSRPQLRHSFIHQWPYSPLLDTGLFTFVIFTRTAGPLGRVVCPSQGRYLHTGQHKHRINAHTDIHALDRSATVIGSYVTIINLLYFIRRWEIQAYLHRTFLPQSCLYNDIR
jgi:hypothetical protein